MALREKQDQQQLKTFTRWWNLWLKENLAEGWSGITVTDLCKEIKPGVISMHLIELLSGTHSIEEKETPSTVFHERENHEKFLALLETKGILLVNIRPADLVAGNLTPVLGLTWTLMKHYELQKFGTEADLLRWVKEVTNNYDGVNVTHWHTSFNDGLALCAVLNKHSSQVTPLPPAPTPTPHPPPSEAAIRPRPRPARELALPTHPTRPHPSARTAPTITPSTTLYSPSYHAYRPYSLHQQSLNYDEIHELSPLDRLNKAFDVAEQSFGAPSCSTYLL